MTKQNKTINKHEKEYIHIPKRSFTYTILFLLSLILIVGMFYVLIDSWKFLGLRDLNEDVEYHLYQLMIIPLFILQYCFIGLSVCLFVSIFKKLKSYNEEGLIFVLIFGLIFVLIFGLIFGLIGGLIVGLIGGLIFGLIFDLIFDLIFGLIFGLICGLIVEFS